MYRFLLTGRWLALALVALVVALTCARLGLWQFDRLGERRAENALITTNLDAEPVPGRTLTAVAESPPAAAEWRPVTFTGSYDDDQRLLLRYQSTASQRGVDVVVPLELSDGTYVLVDRGFLEAPTGAPDPAAVPASPAGRMQVRGWLRRDSAADAEATTPQDGTVRAVSSVALTSVVEGPLRGGWVQAVDETRPSTGSPPLRAAELVAPEAPETGIGPHLFYGMQWFCFGLLALLAYVLFAYDEAHPRHRRRPRFDLGRAAEDPVPHPEESRSVSAQPRSTGAG